MTPTSLAARGRMSDLDKETSPGANTSDALHPRLTTSLDSSSGQSSSDDLSEAYTVHQEESIITYASQDVRPYPNYLLPIARLPPEILCPIFMHLYPLAKAPFKSAAFFGWIPVTHVCRRWRDIALAHRSLWTRIPLELGTDWTTTLLERSKSLPIHLDADEQRDPHIGTVILQNLYRTKSLRLVAGPMSLLHSMVNPAPVIEELSIRDEASLSTLPATFLGGYAPRLRRVKIHSSSRVSWSSRFLRNLVLLQLEVIDPLRALHPPPPVHEVLDALERMPELESLALWEALPRAEAPFDRTISLPHLAFLRLKGSMYDCTRLIGHIQISPAATVKVEMQASHEFPMDFRSFFSAIRTCLGATAAIPVAALSIGVSPYYHNQIVIRVWRELTDVDARRQEIILTDMTLVFTWSPSVADWDGHALRQSICDVFATGHLRMLWVYDDGWDSFHWKELALRAPGIEAISLSPSAGAELRRTLREDYYDDGPRVFPHLKSLFLDRNFDLSFLWKIGQLPMPKYIARLRRILSAREKAGCAATQLTLHPPSW
ncbi:hypothetical protein FA95DRAFT_1679047 [Auriscalpium vulgare]|uniref:Uncharacterized protein n=1 Tax=Auriscalpium vulgare TaxID=40419 RepID=A0ACB8RUB1_9AGAM|nr:hypothetical protein FA95DRAFT_1679047 [Auriscalpium vulgare]